MGKLNLLKAAYTGKVGQTVGAKWKDKSTVRVFTKPAYTNSPAQQIIRAGFKGITQFVSLFAPQIASLSALNTKGMSVRNAIIKLNKEMITDGALDEATLLVAKGGLPSPASVVATVPSGLASLNATWTPATGATISAKARVVIIGVDADDNLAVVGSALNSAGTLSIAHPIPALANLAVYSYLIDYRGSSRVGSVSSYQAITAPSS